MIRIDIHRLALSEIFQDSDEILVAIREQGAFFVQFRGPVSKQNLGPATNISERNTSERVREGHQSEQIPRPSNSMTKKCDYRTVAVAENGELDRLFYQTQLAL